MKVVVVLFLALLTTASLLVGSTPATASPLPLPANFSGSYRILQSRPLALTNGRGYVLQDGALVALASINRARPYCWADQSKFNEIEGSFNAEFVSNTVDGFDHAFVRTIATNPAQPSLTIECIAEAGFTGALDLKLAFGRIVSVSY